MHNKQSNVESNVWQLHKHSNVESNVWQCWAINYNVFRLIYIFVCFSSLPDNLRAKLKSSVIARTSDLENARRFTEHQKQLAKCAGNEYCNEDRSGLIQLMAVLYGETQGLRRPQQLLQACLQLQERRGLKPQTMLNYLATFSNFVDYCYLYSDGVSARMEREHSTMLAAIKSVRKAFSTAAIKNYRTTAK